MRTLNLGILAHVDAGKTTLTERLLCTAGAIDHVGSVDAGTTQTDSLDLERERGITIRSAVAAFFLGDLAVNLVDTPGHPDFIAEVERVLGVLDGAVLVVSAVEGVQSQTMLLFRALRRFDVPTIVFVNKIDRPGARPDWVVNQTFDLFDKLGATEEQLDFTTVYASALNGYAGLGGRPAVQGRGVDHREVELVLGGAELVHQVEGLVHDPVRAGARTVDLVHDDDGVQAEGQRLARDEARLRHRPLDCIHQQQHAVDHRQHALDLAAEIGVAGGVDDVDVRALEAHRAVLGENGDAALALQVVRVHDPFLQLLVGGEGPGLAQQAVDQRGLAMVDVRDDRDVSNRKICHRTHGLARGKERAGRARGRARYHTRG